MLHNGFGQNPALIFREPALQGRELHAPEGVGHCLFDGFFLSPLRYERNENTRAAGVSSGRNGLSQA